MDCSPPDSFCPWDFPGKNAGVGTHFPLQGIFPTQGSNPHLLHWQAGSLPLSHLGCPNFSGGKYLKQILSHELESPTLEATVSNCLATCCGILLSGHHIILLSTQCWSVCMSNETGIHIAALLVVVQLLSHVWLLATWCTAAGQTSLSFISPRVCSNSYQLSVMPSNHLILCCPFFLLPSIFPSIRGSSNESALCIRWPKYWHFSFSISPSNEYSRLIFFRIDWFALLLSKGLSRVISSSTIWKHQFFSAQPSLWSNSPGG